jgi:hypothetical protein
MADAIPLAGLLDRAGKVFSLAAQLGRTFQEDHEPQGGIIWPDPGGWVRHQPRFNEFCAAVLELQEAMQNPPDGFAPVARVLLEAAGLAKQIRDVMQTSEGWTWTSYRSFFPDLNSVAVSGQEAICNVTKARRLDDPFAFVDQLAKGKDARIDTTPTLPKPPSALIETAARDIPGILANVQPQQDGAIESVASELAKQLQDAKHTLAAAQWAIHEAIQAGRLRPSLIEVELPSFGRQVGRREMFGQPDTRRIEWTGGGKETIPIPKGRPAPFDSFKVTATESLWTWWGSSEKADGPEDQRNTSPVASPAEPPTKRSTERSEGRAKLIAALTKHHQYADGGCLNSEPIGNNKLATAAGVSQSTASAFFNREFEGHSKYRTVCRDAGRLAVSLKMLNGEFSPHDLYGRRPTGEDDRDDEADA